MSRDDDMILSRRRALTRLGALALAAYTVPAFTTLSVAEAKGSSSSGGGGGSSGSSGSGGSSGSSSSSSSSSASGSTNNSGSASVCSGPSDNDPGCSG